MEEKDTELSPASQNNRISRRHFFKKLFFIIGCVLAVCFEVNRSNSWILRWIRNLYQRFVSVGGSTDQSRASVDQHVLKSLLAVTEALLDVEVEMNHYENYFRWRLENIPGYKSLYENFIRSLDEEAQNITGENFVSSNKSFRQRCLQNRLQENRRKKVILGILWKDELQYETNIAREIFRLFADTDAWLSLGYESWPGTPRGLADYTKRPNQKLIFRIMK
jgi:hypothetical protein